MIDGWGSGGVSGTLILDDGTNWRVTIIIKGGIVKSVVTYVSTAALAQWTPA